MKNFQVLFASYFWSPCPAIYISSSSMANAPVFLRSIYICMKRSFCGTKQWCTEQPALFCALTLYCLWNCCSDCCCCYQSQGLWKDVTEKAGCRSIYTFCNAQVCSNLQTTSQTQLNCYPISHNACNRRCATWLIAHLMLTFAACYGHSKHCFWRRNTMYHQNGTILPSVHGMNSIECIVFAYNRPSETLMLFNL